MIGEGGRLEHERKENMNDTIQLEKLVLRMVRRFTRFHDNMELKCVRTPRTLNLSFCAHADDVPRIIGSNGLTIRALRAVVQAMADSLQVKVNLNVMEPKVGKRLVQEPFRVNPDYQITEDEQLLREVGGAIFNDGVSVNWVSTDTESATLVLVVEAERNQYDQELERSLSTIWNAIGKSHGKKLCVEIELREPVAGQ